MRLVTCLLFIFICFGASAQTRIPVSRPFSEKHYFLDTNTYLRAHKLAEIADSIQKLEKIAGDAGDREFAGQLRLFATIRAFRERNISPDSIERTLVELAAEANSNSLPHLEADVLHNLGEFYSENNQRQSAAIEHFISAYAIYKNFTPDEFPSKQAYIYTLGGAFYRYEDYESSIKYLQEALGARRSTNKNIFCSISNTIGLCYRQMRKYDSAILYFQRTYNDAVKLDNKAWMGIAQGNIGITYFLQKKYAGAIPLLQQDIESSLATINVRNALGSMAILATIYNDQQEYGRAEKLLNDALQLGESRSFWPDYALAEQLYTQLARVYAARKNYKRAYAYADSALMAKDSVSRRNNTLTLSKAHEKENFIRHKLESEKLQNQVKIGLLELGKKRIEVTFTFIGIAILLAVIFFIARERKRSENLLLNILPEKIAERLKKKEHPIADYFDHASIIFIDMAGFTVFSDGRDPKEIVNILNHVFTTFDNIAERHGLEKIKTIGDCYMAVSGLPEANPEHAEAATQMALDIKAEMKGMKAADGTPIEFRIGLDCGPVVAGVIGRRKFIYDLWGDTVNTASRMESTGVAGEIHCTDRFKKIIEGRHKFVNRGQLEIKGKGAMETWLITE